MSGRRDAASNGVEKTHSAEVRASRARSRVKAKKSKAKGMTVESISRPTATSTPGRSRKKAPQNAGATVAVKKMAGAAEGKKRREDGPGVSGLKLGGPKPAGKDGLQGGKRKKEEERKKRYGGKPAWITPATGRKEKKAEKGKASKGTRAAATGLEIAEPVALAPQEQAGQEVGRRGKRAGSGKFTSNPARTLFLGTLLVISLGALLWVYTSTGVLNVKHVEVRGNEVLDEDCLRSLSGITGDTHLLKMDVKAAERALLSEPYIAGVDISRHYPNTVVLEINERQPSGAIFQNGKYYLVDQEGMILESVDAVPEGMVEIKDLELPLLMPGLELGGVDFAAVTSLVGSLPPQLREIAEAVGVREGEGLYLEGAGTTVIYGEANNLSRKNDIALMALRDLVQDYGAVDYIDVSFPDHPVIKPSGDS